VSAAAKRAPRKTLASDDDISKVDDRMAFRLCLWKLTERGHMPGHWLDPGTFVLLIHLLALGPDVQRRRRTLAGALGSSESRIKLRLSRLRAINLVPGVPLLRCAIDTPSTASHAGAPARRTARAECGQICGASTLRCASCLHC
jgi:hypothetical protein